MRILQVSPRYAPAWAFGGGVRMFWLLATQLAERGHEITVVTSDSVGPTERHSASVERLHPKILVRRFPNRRPGLATRLTPLFFRPRGMREALYEVAREVDVMHMGESRGIHNLWTAEAAESTRVPLAWSAYGGLAKANGIRGLYRRLHDLAITRRVVPRVSAFIAQSEHEAEVYAGHGTDLLRIHRIPLCVEVQPLNRLPVRGELRRRLGLPTEAELVVCVARLSPVKGIDKLIRAFARLRLTRPAHLAIVGWDHGAQRSYEDLVRRLGVANRVSFCGPLYGDDRYQAYVDADVFALAPRVYEETSLAALEAAACGVATVLTARCEIPGLARAGGGLVVEDSDEAVAQGLEALLADAGRRKDLSTTARDFVSANFSPASVAAQHERLFAEMIT